MDSAPEFRKPQGHPGGREVQGQQAVQLYRGQHVPGVSGNAAECLVCPGWLLQVDMAGLSKSELVQYLGLSMDMDMHTEGVKTVGLFTALEVIANFPGEGIEPLKDFRQWSSRV